MTQKQRTIAKPFSLSGRGIHTGVHSEIVFRPAPENHGYKFKRTDLDGEPIIDAVIENVSETERSTSIEKDGVRIWTVEHVLSALYGCQIDNVLIEINAQETPILDGSARYYVNAIQEVGIVEQDANREYFQVTDPIIYRNEEKGIEISIFPAETPCFTVLIDYNKEVLSHQYATLDNIEDYAAQIAPCRTFAFLTELELMLKHGLIKGGDLDNAIVFIDKKLPQDELDRLAALFNKTNLSVQTNGILNNLELNFFNEAARHKLLDLIGDLALIGVHFKGKVIATKPGHSANVEFAKAIKKEIKKMRSKNAPPRYNPTQPPLYDIMQVQKILPHRPPFLLVDKILEKDETSIVGLKNVTMNEAFFVGHFPHEPVMPGVLQVEAMAQVGGILVLSTVPDPENYITYFMKLQEVKFRGKVVPGDTILFRLTLASPVRRGIVHMIGQAFVGDKIVMDAEMMAQIVKVK